MKIQYTEAAQKVLNHARRQARAEGAAGNTGHLLYALVSVKDTPAAILLEEAGVSADRIRELMQARPEKGETALADRKDWSPRAEELLISAARAAENYGDGIVGTEHILFAILKTECTGRRLLRLLEIDMRLLYEDTARVMGADKKNGESDSARERRGDGSQSTLESYSRDLTALAENGELDPVIGRDREISRVMQILSRRTKNNPCLIGEPGVGKTAIVEGLAQRIALGAVPESMQGRRVLILDLSGMVAGTKYRGEFEERIKKVIDEVRRMKNIILFVDELHTMIGAGGAEGALDAANILKPSLSRGEIQMIGATTLEEYRKHIEKDAALERRFQMVMVEEPSSEETVEILRGLRSRYERHHSLLISDEAITSAVALSERYINDRRLPDKAIDLIDEACARVRLGGFGGGSLLARELERREAETAREQAILNGHLEEARELTRKLHTLSAAIDTEKQKRSRLSRADRKTVGEEDVAAVVSDWTNIPAARLTESEARRLSRLEKVLHNRVIGQDEAVHAVSSAIKRGRVGLKDPKRPTGTFLFLGPTGVGKTELSKAVAEAVYGSEKNMIRVDMSEYMEKYSVSRMIGSPPGYVGYDEGGQLSEQVRRHPYSVILFDEIEKAHPDVFNILLQVLDEGHITDSHGRRVDFKNTCIIMTSNAGAQAIVDPKKLGFSSKDDAEKDYQRMKTGVMAEVRRIFRPEFLNRIDEIIVFHPLSKKQVEEIVSLMCAEVVQRAEKEMGLILKITGDAKRHIAETAYSPKFGARPLRRAIQEKIENPMADKVLDGEIGRGSRVTVRCTQGNIRIDVHEAKKEDSVGGDQ